MQWQTVPEAQEYEIALSEARLAQVLVLMTGSLQASPGSDQQLELVEKAAWALRCWWQQGGHSEGMQQLLGRLAHDWSHLLPSCAATVADGPVGLHWH